MNPNLRCVKCDSILQQDNSSISDKLYFSCQKCHIHGTRVHILEENPDILEYYHFYIKRNNKLYYFYSASARSNHAGKTVITSFPESIFNNKILFNKHFIINTNLPLKDQAEKLIDNLLKMSIFV